MSGRLFVVEGLDGVGKSTLSKLLAARLGARRMSTPGGEVRSLRAQIDQAWEVHAASLQLFYAATVLAAGEQAEQVLASGQDVVMDRYWLSTLAYAVARGACLPLADVARRLPAPEATVWLWLPEEERLRRLQARGMTGHDHASVLPLQREVLNAAYRTLLDLPETSRLVGRPVRVEVSGHAPEPLAELVFRELEAQSEPGGPSAQLSLFPCV